MRFYKSSEDPQQELWDSASHCMELGYRDTAIREWLTMIETDPFCADALLGLYSAACYLENHIQRLADSAESLGEYRLPGSLIVASYLPSGWVRVTMETRRDVIAALVAEQIARGDLEDARINLESLNSTEPVVAALHANLHRAREEWDLVIVWAQKAMPFEAIQFDLRIMLNQAYVALGLHEIAVRAIEDYVDQGPTIEARRFARYRLGHAYHAAGESAKARIQWADIYAVDSGYLNVAELLGIDPDALVAANEKIADDQSWSDLVGSLESGEVATDPTIGDNSN